MFFFFQNTYNTQKRIPSFLYQQLKNVAKKTTIKMLKNHANKMTSEEEKKTVEENIAKCKTFFDRSSMRMLNEYMSKDPNEVFTLCHGDFWSNNIMFNYQVRKRPI